MSLNIGDILAYMKAKGASDLHITAESAPALRIDGEMVMMPGEKLSVEMAEALVYSLMTSEQKKRFEETKEMDCSIAVSNIGRFRVNVFRQRGCVGAAIRVIPEAFKTFEQLGLPAVTYDITKLPNGLVLVSGPTGSGKSTTLASIINRINEERTGHIVTVEDPIEFIHPHKRSIVNQREIGHDTDCFENALKHILRQDPDVILIGEMRDLETIQAALNIAETGHLVFATLHTNDAAQSINRVIDVFPSHQQSQVRTQLSFVLKATISQQLLAHISGKGRVMACEVLIATPAVRNLIREGKIEQMPMSIQTGSKYGMQSMNQSLADLYHRKLITYETAMESSTAPEDLRKMLTQRAGVTV